MVSRVVKASGEVEPYEREKLVASLVACGLSRQAAKAMAIEIEEALPEVASTYEIHSQVEALLRERHPRSALRYVLKRALARLGPEGYPFERYFARVLEKLGFSTRVGVVATGRCVDHEIDVVAEKSGRRYLVECKYHSAPGAKTDVKVALYVYARFLDLRDYFDCAWIATNAKLTSKAARYAECVGMRTTAWKYPKGEGLEALVERTGLYPITALSAMSETARRRLLAAGYVALEDLRRMSVDELSERAGIPAEEAERILEGASLLVA